MITKKILFWTKESIIAILAMVGIFVGLPIIIAILLGVFFGI